MNNTARRARVARLSQVAADATRDFKTGTDRRREYSGDHSEWQAYVSQWNWLCDSSVLEEGASA